MSDIDYCLRYTVIQSDISLKNYIAEIQLKPVTDEDWTFWSWNSEFEHQKGKKMNYLNSLPKKFMS